MASSGPSQNATVEEILASIRQAISEDDTRRTLERNRSAPGSRGARRPVASVTSVFAESEHVAADDDSDGDESETEATSEPSPDQGVIDLAIDQALDGVRAEMESTQVAQSRLGPRPAGEALSRSPARAMPRAIRGTALRREIPMPRPALMSPRSDSQISASFDDLAKTMIEGNARKLDETVEELLRPMLKTWLESNLPQMVERMVREEIERVSRGRR